MSNKKRTTGRPSRYPLEFQRDAVAMVLDEKRLIADVARSIGVIEGTLGNWVAKARRERDAGRGATPDERAENVELRVENAQCAVFVAGCAPRFPVLTATTASHRHPPDPIRWSVPIATRNTPSVGQPRPQGVGVGSRASRPGHSRQRNRRTSDLSGEGSWNQSVRTGRDTFVIELPPSEVATRAV